MARLGTARAIAAAHGDIPADLLLVGGRVFSPTTLEWLDTDLAVTDGFVVAWGRRDAVRTIDLAGAAVTPGFIDAHMHLESTKLWVDEFARAVVPHGTVAVAADPHEIANVFGVRGVLALAESARGLPLTFGICASSSVPVSAFESSGAVVGPDDVADLLERGAIGVAEVGDYPGVLRGDPVILAKIAAAGHRRVDGHAPGLRGADLDAYLTAGIESDHECTHLAEAEEKRRKGMWVFVREGSASRNLEELIPMVLRHGGARVALCTDDREPDLLLTAGHVNDCVRLAVRAGLPLEQALVLATMNAADYHGFAHLGHTGPGYHADLLVFDRLDDVRPSMVLHRGEVVARGGAMVPGSVPSSPAPQWMHRSVHASTAPVAAALDLVAPLGGMAHVIGVRSGTIVTDHLVLDVTDPAVDVARIAAVERHRGTGRVGLGYVSGFGLLRGAIASTVAHDAHNVVVAGGRGADGPADMACAVARLRELGGGQVSVLDGRVVAEVALPIGGLMSDRPAAEVAAALEHLHAMTDRYLGVRLAAPFMHLSFLALSAIPQLRISDLGLVDVDRWSLTDVAASP